LKEQENNGMEILPASFRKMTELEAMKTK